MYKTLNAPLVVQIEIESACTNTCLHCYNFWRKDKNIIHSRLSPSDLEIVMNKLATEGVFEIVFTGGEPLLNKRTLFYGLELAKKLGIGASLNSNLIPLTYEDAVFLKKSDLHSILTSIMGPCADIHDDIAQRKGAFKETLQGIKYLQKVGFTPLVNIVISQRNKKHLKETINFLVSIGIKHISSTRVGCPGNCSDFSAFSLSLEDFRHYLDELYTAGQENSVSVGVLESYPFCGIKELKKYQEFLGRRCSAGVTTVTISSDGTVRPCSHLDVQYGNLMIENLKTIWLRMNDWRNGSIIPNECKKCPLVRFCGGGCRMEAKMRGGSFTAMDPYSSIIDIDIAIQQFNNLSKSKKEIQIPLTFKLAKGIRIRNENFGSVIFVNHRFKSYLNKKATDFLRKLRPEVVYTIEEIIKLGEYNKKELEVFIPKLFIKKIILPK